MSTYTKISREESAQVLREPHDSRVDETIEEVTELVRHMGGKAARRSRTPTPEHKMRDFVLAGLPKSLLVVNMGLLRMQGRSLRIRKLTIDARCFSDGRDVLARDLMARSQRVVFRGELGALHPLSLIAEMSEEGGSLYFDDPSVQISERDANAIASITARSRAPFHLYLRDPASREYIPIV